MNRKEKYLHRSYTTEEVAKIYGMTLDFSTQEEIVALLEAPVLKEENTLKEIYSLGAAWGYTIAAADAKDMTTHRFLHLIHIDEDDEEVTT